jgi:REP element-mobilizing transposase RayT
MPRTPREEGAGLLHHVIAKGSGGETIVRDDVDRQALLGHIGASILRYRWTCLAYCLLDSHFHLVVATPAANLGRGMQLLLARYARDFNTRHNREGNLFHTRFYSRRIESEAHLLSSIIYVVLNPVRAGLVDGAEHWHWSSHRATIGTASPPPFLASDAVLEIFGPSQPEARMRFELAVAQARARDLVPRPGVRHGV